MRSTSASRLRVSPASAPPANSIAPASATHLATDWAPFRIWIASRDQHPRPVRFPGERRRIMVGADFSPASDSAMGVVFAIAATTGTVVDLVHVFDGFTEGLVLGNRPLLDNADAVLARIDRTLRARTAAAAGDGVRCVATSLVGAPGIELTAHADRTGADLLVLGVGDDSRGPFGRAWSADAAAQAMRTGAWHQRPLLSTTSF